MTRTTIFAVTLIAASALSAWAGERPPLKDDTQLENGLIIAAAAHQVNKRCDDVGLRLLKSYNFLKSLEARADGLGYSSAEFEAYVDADENRQRIDAKAKAYLASLGVKSDDHDTYCDAARTEIAANRGIGPYFRAN